MDPVSGGELQYKTEVPQVSDAVPGSLTSSWTASEEDTWESLSFHSYESDDEGDTQQSRATPPPSCPYNEERSLNGVIHELITTEEKYVAGVEVLCDVYISKICEKKGRGKAKREKALLERWLSAAKLVRRCNEMLLFDLRKWKRDPTPPSITDILSQHLPRMVVYSEYISMYETCVKMVTAEVEELDYCTLQADPLLPTGYDSSFYGLSITPVQRLTKYLQFTELLCQKEGSREAYLLKQEINELVVYCNQRKKESDSFQKVGELGKKMKIPDLQQPCRIIIKEGTLSKARGSVPDQYTAATLFLFSDTILCWKQKTSFWARRYIQIPLVDVDSLELRFISGCDFTVKSSRECLYFRAASPKEALDWTSAITLQSDKLRSGHNSSSRTRTSSRGRSRTPAPTPPSTRSSSLPTRIPPQSPLLE